MPNYPVPAKRYDIFITAFEKYVAERQKEIAKADRLMRPYEIARAALERADILNDTRLELRKDGIYINIVVQENDRREKFEKILQNIGEELYTVKLHPDGAPAYYHGQLSFRYFWKLRGIAGKDEEPPEVEVVLNIPVKGTKFVRVTKEEKQSTWTNSIYTSTWIEGVPVTSAMKVTNDGEEIPF